MNDDDILNKTKDWSDDKEYTECHVCGKPIEAKTNKTRFCSFSCKSRYARDKFQDEYDSTETDWRKDYFILLKDPINTKDGGFKPGAKFSREEVDSMAENGAFTEGTILYSVLLERIIIYGSKRIPEESQPNGQYVAE